MSWPTPPSGSVGVRFIRGRDEHSTFPDAARRAGLTHRFAVVQDTYVEGHADMFFDEDLWRTLLAFLRGQAGQLPVEIVREGRDPAPVHFDQFMIDWDLTAPQDREPPPVVTVGEPARPQICMYTDYWTRAGGPDLYHDSYTYSVFAGRDLGLEIMAALEAAPSRDQWAISPKPVETNWMPSSPSVSLWRLLLARLTGQDLPR